jgi:hypothetical protein
MTVMMLVAQSTLPVLHGVSIVLTVLIALLPLAAFKA